MEKGRKTVLTGILIAAAVVLAGLAAATVLLWESLPTENPGNSTADSSTQETTEETTQETTEETTVPPAGKISSATISATGDILLHQRVIDSGFDKTTGLYNYDSIFPFFAKYVQAADCAVANMEGTLCGTEGGRKYKGYPCFNVPDAIVDASKAAGFDVLMTANNHCYDTKSKGFKRTQEVITDRGLAPLGTIPAPDKPNYLIQDLNGIQVGMLCYTYESAKQEGVDKSLNGIPMSNTDAPLINSFRYNNLDVFYDELEQQMEEMQNAGAEAFVMFIHWGTEYKTTPNSWQKKIGQQLCDMGIDVIVGGHAHVIQPITVFTSRTDPNHSTLCLYSLGNAVSNIRLSSTRPVHCEDGLLFSFTFAKYSDGSVIVEKADILPTWVNRHKSSRTGKEVFEIVPLDPEIPDWKASFDLTDSTYKQALASRERTLEILSEGLAKANAHFAAKQAILESDLLS